MGHQMNMYHLSMKFNTVGLVVHVPLQEVLFTEERIILTWRGFISLPIIVQENFLPLHLMVQVVVLVKK